MKPRSDSSYDNLSEHQADTMRLGFSYDEVVDLNEAKINYLKQGLKRTEMLGLTDIQIAGYLGLEKHGLTLDLIRSNIWLATQDIFLALSFLIKYKDYNLVDAMNFLKDLSLYDIKGICHNIMPKQTKDMSDEEKMELFARSTEIYFDNVKWINKLEDIQIKLVEQLYPWVNCDMLLNQICLPEAKYRTTLIFLVKQKYFSFSEAVELIQNLSDSQLEGIRLGLSRDEVNILENIFQMRALASHKTYKNNLFAADFENTSWFNSLWHEKTFHFLLMKQELTVNEIFAEMKVLSSEKNESLCFNAQSKNKIPSTDNSPRRSLRTPVNSPRKSPLIMNTSIEAFTSKPSSLSARFFKCFSFVGAGVTEDNSREVKQAPQRRPGSTNVGD